VRQIFDYLFYFDTIAVCSPQNNRLQGITELMDSDDSDMEIWHGTSNNPPAQQYAEIVSGQSKLSAATVAVPTKPTYAEVAKQSAIDSSSKDKLERMRRQAKKQINFDKDMDELDDKEKKKHESNMKALKWYSKNIRDNTCDEVTSMLDGGDDDWMPGQSQDMHQQVLNTRAYQY
jgi:hypothetical protein